MGLSNYIPSSRIAQSGVCTSTTRPATPFEGQMIYETDTDMLAIWNGTAWRYIAATTPTNGTVLQIVSTSDTTQRSTNSDYPVVSTLNATITPKSSSSKILILANIHISTDTAGTNTNKICVVGLSYGTNSTTSIHRNRFSANMSSTSSDLFGNVSMTLLHEPATTSSCVYNVLYGRYSSTFNNGVVINGDVGGGNGRSTITLMEIAG